MEGSFFIHTRREELMRKFLRETTTIFLNGILSIYGNVKKNNKIPKMLLKEFQQSMVNVSLWSQEIIKNEHHRFISLFPAFDKYVQLILQTYQSKQHTVPHDFLHQSYLNLARKLWKQPFLVYDIGVSKIDVQKNLLRIEKVICECIKDTFDAFGNTDDFDEPIQVELEVEQLTQEHDINDAIDNIKDTQKDNTENGHLHDSSQWTIQDGDNIEEDVEEDVESDSDVESLPNDDVSSIAAKGEMLLQNGVFNIDQNIPIERSFAHEDDDVISENDTQSRQSSESDDDENLNDLQIWEGAEDEPGIKDIESSIEQSPVQFDVERNEEPVMQPSFENDVIVTKLNHEEEDMQELEDTHSVVDPKNIKLVTFDEKSEKIRSLLNLKKKVKSSLANKRTLYPSFF